MAKTKTKRKKRSDSCLPKINQFFPDSGLRSRVAYAAATTATFAAATAATAATAASFAVAALIWTLKSLADQNFHATDFSGSHTPPFRPSYNQGDQMRQFHAIWVIFQDLGSFFPLDFLLLGDFRT